LNIQNTRWREFTEKEDIPLDFIPYLAMRDDSYHKKYLLAEINEKNLNTIGALLATNTANILNRLQQKDLQQLEQWVKNPPTKRLARKAFCMGGVQLKNDKNMLTRLFHNPRYDKNLVPLIFDMAGIATEKQEAASRNPVKKSALS